MFWPPLTPNGRQQTPSSCLFLVVFGSSATLECFELNLKVHLSPIKIRVKNWVLARAKHLSIGRIIIMLFFCYSLIS